MQQPQLDPTIIRDVIARIGVVYDIRKLNATAVIQMLCDSLLAFAMELGDEDCRLQLLDREIDNEDALLQAMSEVDRAYVNAAKSPRQRRWRIGIVASPKSDPRSVLVEFLAGLVFEWLQASPESYAISQNASSRVH